jgi:hypothetical protein
MREHKCSSNCFWWLKEITIKALNYTVIMAWSIDAQAAVACTRRFWRRDVGGHTCNFCESFPESDGIFLVAADVYGLR